MQKDYTLEGREKELLRVLWSQIQNPLLWLSGDKEIQQYKLTSKADRLMGKGLPHAHRKYNDSTNTHLLLIIRQE